MVFHGPLPAENRAYARFLRSRGNLSIRKIGRLCNMSHSSVIRCSKSDLPGRFKPQNRRRLHDIHSQGAQRSGGRTRKLSTRTERYMLRELRKLRRSEGTFAIARLMTVTGISQADVTIRTVNNVLHRHGYCFYQTRKKGLLSENDLKCRVKFAKK